MGAALPIRAPGADGLVRLPWPNGLFLYQPALWSPALAADLFVRLHAEIAWQQQSLRLFGRWQPVPRLTCWQGDAGARYRYSGVLHRPVPWTPTVLALRDRIGLALAGTATAAGSGGQPETHFPAGRPAVRFNSVLANLYRNGADGVGWHSDDEPELGPEPLIASASFGAPRRFVLRHRGLGLRRELLLQPGSLLVMAGTSQRYWQHSVPKTARPCGPRLNLTFRWIFPHES